MMHGSFLTVAIFCPGNVPVWYLRTSPKSTFEFRRVVVFHPVPILVSVPVPILCISVGSPFRLSRICFLDMRRGWLGETESSNCVYNMQLLGPYTIYHCLLAETWDFENRNEETEEECLKLVINDELLKRIMGDFIMWAFSHLQLFFIACFLLFWVFSFPVSISIQFKYWTLLSSNWMLWNHIPCYYSSNVSILRYMTKLKQRIRKEKRGVSLPTSVCRP